MHDVDQNEKNVNKTDPSANSNSSTREQPRKLHSIESWNRGLKTESAINVLEIFEHIQRRYSVFKDVANVETGTK